MSDDEFGDFAEATEEVKHIDLEILVDHSKRPLDHLPSVFHI